MTQTIEVLVQRRQHEAEGIISLDLVPVTDTPLPPFTPGAHIDVHVPVVGLVRQYSLVNDPRETNRYVIAVQQDPNSRGGSVGVHQYMQAGQRLQISSPRNHFELVPAPRFMLIAGGIGITPLLAMARHLSEQNLDFALHYVTRTRARMAFYESLQNSAFADRVYLYHSAEAEGAEFNVEQLLAWAQDDAHIYVCGPSSLIDTVVQQSAAAQIASERVHREYFHNDTVAAETDGPFHIRIASTGAEFLVEADQRITQVLEANGFFVPVSCEEGVCGTCLTGVLEGEVEHRDVYLTEEERAANNQMALCCSRARSSSLTLDL